MLFRSLDGMESHAMHPTRNARGNMLSYGLDGNHHDERNGASDIDDHPEGLYYEEDHGRSISIMSLNSLACATIRERSNEEEDENDLGDSDVLFDRSQGRSQRSLVSPAVMSTPAAYISLLNEHENLLDRNEDLVEVQARRKAEKNQINKVLMSKQEEYVERRDRLEWLQGRLDFLNVQRMNVRATSSSSCSRAVNRSRSKQKEAWEELDTEVSKLDVLRSEHKRLVDKLLEEPTATQADAQMEMHLQRRRRTTKQLEIQATKLKEDVELLRQKKKAGEGDDTSVSIGPEINCDDPYQTSLSTVTT